jgi:hypothetical protein
MEGENQARRSRGLGNCSTIAALNAYPALNFFLPLLDFAFDLPFLSTENAQKTNF